MGLDFIKIKSFCECSRNLFLSSKYGKNKIVLVSNKTNLKYELYNEELDHIPTIDRPYLSKIIIVYQEKNICETIGEIIGYTFDIENSMMEFIVSHDTVSQTIIRVY